MALILKNIRSKRWVLPALWLSACGCLLGPDITPAEEETLFAPEIVLGSLEPADTGLSDIDTECRLTKFKVGLVRDRNLKDVLFVRWFLDWDAAAPTLGEVKTSFIGAENLLERTGPALEWVLDTSILPLDREVYTVKVVVADRALKDQGIEFPDPVEGQEGQEGQLDTYQWVFRLADGGMCLAP